MPDGPVERSIGVLILLVLAATGTTLVLRQLRHVPAEPPADPAHRVEAHEPSAPLELGGLLPGWDPAGPKVRFDPDRLFEKINGQADLYLQAGFDRLEAQRFLDPDDPTHSVELRAYRMHSAAAASSVHARQRRPGGERPDPALDAECAEGSCFLSQGPWYLEVLPSPPGPILADASRRAMLGFAAAHPVRIEDAPDPRAGFPAAELEEGSVATDVQDAYGLASLDGAATATYQGESGAMLAWRIETASPAEAEALAQRVQDELLGLGAQLGPAPRGVRLQEIFGSTCASRVTGSVVVGVQEVPHTDAALELLALLAGEESTP